MPGPIQSSNSIHTGSLSDIGDLFSLMQDGLGETHREAIADTLKDMGNAYYVNDEFAKAIRCYTLAATSFAPKPVYTCNLAGAYLKRELYSHAEAAATQSLLYDPTSIKARFRRAVARKALNNVNAAIQDLRIVVKYDPSVREASGLLKEIDHGHNSQLDPRDEYPGYHSKPAGLRARDIGYKETEAENHRGNGTPCFYYNHDGCDYGAKCRFSHTQDSESVRDKSGKNVCLGFLTNQCKQSATKCPYRHDTSDLSSDARAIVDRLQTKKDDKGTTSDRPPQESSTIFPPFIQLGLRMGGMGLRPSSGYSWDGRSDDGEGEDDEEEEDTGSVVHEPGPNGDSTRRFTCSNACSHCTGPINDDQLLTVIVTLREKSGLFDEINKLDIQKLHSNAPMQQVFTVDAGIRVLSRPGPVNIYVTDPGIMLPTAQSLAKRIKERVEQGAHVVFGAQFSSFAKPLMVKPFFTTQFNLSWASGGYSREDFVKNTAHPLVRDSGSEMPTMYSMKALRLSGARPDSVVYIEDGQTLASTTESPVLYAKVGNGTVGYIGDVNAEEETTSVLLCMLGLVRVGGGERRAGGPRTKQTARRGRGQPFSPGQLRGRGRP